MKTLKCRIVGLLPLIVHRGGLANPLDPFSKEIKAISGKRKKVDADYEQMAKLEFLGGLYVDEHRRPILPASVIEAVIVEAAKKERKKKDAQAAIFAHDAILEYDGPKSPEELWNLPKFRDSRGVRVGQARIIRTRPRFDQWAATVTIEFDDSLVNQSEVERLLKIAGEQVGLCEMRPKFGRFQVESIQAAKAA